MVKQFVVYFLRKMTDKKIVWIQAEKQLTISPLSPSIDVTNTLLNFEYSLLKILQVLIMQNGLSEKYVLCY